MHQTNSTSTLLPRLLVPFDLIRIMTPENTPSLLIILMLIPSSSTILSSYPIPEFLPASSTMPFRQLFNTFVETYFPGICNKLSSHSSSQFFTLVIEKYPQPVGPLNHMFEAAMAYLRETETARFCGEFQVAEQENLEIICEDIRDSYKGVEMRWKFFYTKYKNLEDDDTGINYDKLSYELTCLKEHIDIVLNSYLEHILEQEKTIKKESNRKNFCSSNISFDDLSMDPEKKKAVLDDLNTFMNGKEFYRRIGKPWNRRYLIHGPPGAGKSRLISAMADHLNYGIYELDCTYFHHVAAFVHGLPHQSILVIKNAESSQNDDTKQEMVKDLIQMTGGLWSYCGSECIIVVVTNRIESIDSCFRLPSHMDMIIDMSSCNRAIES